MCGGGGGGGGGDGGDGVDSGASGVGGVGGGAASGPGGVGSAVGGSANSGPGEGGHAPMWSHPAFATPGVSAVAPVAPSVGVSAPAPPPRGPGRLLQARPGPDLYESDPEAASYMARAPSYVGSGPVSNAVASALWK